MFGDGYIAGCTVLNWVTDGLFNAVSHGGDNCVGSSYTFSCNSGYTNYSGDTVRMCKCDNTWSGSPLSCAGEYRSNIYLCTPETVSQSKSTLTIRFRNPSKSGKLPVFHVNVAPQVSCVAQ